MSRQHPVITEFTGLHLVDAAPARPADGLVPDLAPSAHGTQTATQTAPVLFFASAIVRMSSKMMRQRSREVRAELATNIAETTRLRIQLRATAKRLRLRLA